MSEPSKPSRRRDGIVMAVLVISLAANVALVVDRLRAREPSAAAAMTADAAPALEGADEETRHARAGGARGERGGDERRVARDMRPMEPLDAGPARTTSPAEVALREGRAHAALSDALVAACDGCGVPDASVSVTARVALDGRLADVRVRRGDLDAAGEACLTRSLSGFQTGLTPEHERYFILRREGGTGHVTESEVPFLHESALEFPGVDPADVAQSCFEMSDYPCAVRAIRRIESPTLFERRHLLSSLVALEDWTALEAELRRAPVDRAAQYSDYHAVLWRIEHGLPPGDVPRPFAPGPFAD